MHAFRAAVETWNFDAIDELFADDIVFWSPVAHKPYQGKAMVKIILQAVSQVFEDFAYEREIGAEGAADHALVFHAKVDGLEIQGCDFLHANENGLIDEFTVMVRPLKAATKLAEKMRIKYEEGMAAFAAQQ